MSTKYKILLFIEILLCIITFFVILPSIGTLTTTTTKYSIPILILFLASSISGLIIDIIIILLNEEETEGRADIPIKCVLFSLFFIITSFAISCALFVAIVSK